MRYKLRFHELALAEWVKLDNSVREPLKKKLIERLENPRISAAALLGMPNCYKIKLLRVGYRLVYRVEDDCCWQTRQAKNIHRSKIEDLKLRSKPSPRSKRCGYLRLTMTSTYSFLRKSVLETSSIRRKAGAIRSICSSGMPKFSKCTFHWRTVRHTRSITPSASAPSNPNRSLAA